MKPSYTAEQLRELFPECPINTHIVSITTDFGENRQILDHCGTMGLCPDCQGKSAGCGRLYVWATIEGQIQFTANLSDGTVRFLTRDEYEQIIGQLKKGCHAGKDGDCIWPECPQLRDNEPATSGRSCPLWKEQTDD